jgi:hypothetical protein
MGNTSDITNEYGKKYEILQNGEGDILIIIAHCNGEPVTPKIIYDGGSTVLLYRNKESSFFLTDIAENARHPIQYANKITIAEVNNNNVLREYVAQVRLIKNMKDIFN